MFWYFVFPTCWGCFLGHSAFTMPWGGVEPVVTFAATASTMQNEGQAFMEAATAAAKDAAEAAKEATGGAQ